MSQGQRYRMRILFTWNGLSVSTGLHVRQDGVLNNFTALVDDVREWWNVGYTSPTVAPMKTFYPTVALWSGVDLRNSDVPTEPPQLHVEDPAIAGTAGSVPMGPKNAVVITTVTALVGRKYRGRMYLPAMDESKSDAGGRLSSTDATTLADSVLRLINSLAVDGFGAGVLSRVGAGNFQPITDTKCGRDFDVQRRRRYKPEPYFT